MCYTYCIPKTTLDLYYDHRGSCETNALRERYGCITNRISVVELLTLALISNVVMQLEICTITEEFTLKAVFLGIYIFICLRALLLEVRCS